MVDSQDTLLREVHEELRREKMAKLWKQYGTLVIAGLALLLAGIGGWRWYVDAKARAAATAGATFATAVRQIEAGKSEDAVKALSALTTSAPTGYATLAAWRLAAKLADEGKTEDAAKGFQDIANDPKADVLLRDLAVIKFASLKLDGSTFAATKNRLTDQAFDGRPWRTSARELIAIAAMKDGQKDEARQALEQIMADRDSSAVARERAGTLLGILTAAEVQAQGSAPASPPSGTAASTPATGATPKK